MLAFPSTYTVGITSLGYQVVWATLAQRADVDVRRLFTDQGDPPHRHCDLFGLSLSWELDGPVLLDLLEQQRIPIWANQRFVCVALAVVPDMVTRLLMVIPAGSQMACRKIGRAHV